MKYKDELIRSMEFLAQDERTIFLGQSVKYSGNAIFNTLESIDDSKKIETPVFEDVQMGMSLGMAMVGQFVVTFYPRWDFLICATNQLVNHVDKINLMSQGKWQPNMIIRLGKGSDKPLDPDHQHRGNYLEEFKSLCPNIQFHDLLKYDNVETIYKNAYSEGGIHVIVEYPELYYV